MTKSNACFDFSSGSRAMTTERPGSPTTSPRKRTVSIFDHRIKAARTVDVKINDEIQSSNDEAITNDEARTVPFRHSGFVILSSLVIRAASFLVVFLSIFPATSHAGDNLGILGSKPKWSVLENYQETITHDEFSRLIQNVYCTHGFAPDLIEINEKTVRLLMNRDSQKCFTLRFAEDDTGRKPVPRLWRPAKSLSPSRPDKPLSGLKIALNPGHLGGKWAKMGERWFQVGDSQPVQ